MSAKTFVNPRRHEIAAFLRDLPVQTGDIIFRLPDTRGVLGIHFSALVAKLTKSKYSHASLIYVREGVGIYCLEVNDTGVVEYRLIDWLDFCVGGEFSLYRVKDAPEGFRGKVYAGIMRYLDEDRVYDATYGNKPDGVYCTESVAKIYAEAGLDIFKPSLIKDVLSRFTYGVFVVLNSIVKWLTKSGFSTTTPAYFVGNETKGMLSCDKIECLLPENTIKGTK